MAVKANKEGFFMANLNRLANEKWYWDFLTLKHVDLISTATASLLASIKLFDDSARWTSEAMN